MGAAKRISVCLKVITMVKAKFKVGGMDCASCSATIEKAVKQLAGVADAKASFAVGELMVDYDPRTATPQDIRKKVEQAGYSMA